MQLLQTILFYAQESLQRYLLLLSPLIKLIEDLQFISFKIEEFIESKASN